MKREKHDRLEQDVNEAERLGYGCHYGDYMAAKEHNTTDYIRRKETAAPPKREKIPEDRNGPVIITKKGSRVCQICGKPLGKFAKKYCQGECQAKAYDRHHNVKPGKI